MSEEKVTIEEYISLTNIKSRAEAKRYLITLNIFFATSVVIYILYRILLYKFPISSMPVLFMENGFLFSLFVTAGPLLVLWIVMVFFTVYASKVIKAERVSNTYAIFCFLFAPISWIWFYPRIMKPLRIILGKEETPSREFIQQQGAKEKKVKSNFWLKAIVVSISFCIFFLVLTWCVSRFSSPKKINQNNVAKQCASGLNDPRFKVESASAVDEAMIAKNNGTVAEKEQLLRNKESRIEGEIMNKDWIESDPVRMEVSKSIPKGSFFRDLEKIPGTNKYLGIYISDYSFYDRGNLSFHSCDELVYGQTDIEGDYYLFLFDGGDIIAKKNIPKYNCGDDGQSTEVFLNTKSNNEYIYGSGVEGNNRETERTKLINFHDYTGDGLEHEFNMVGCYNSCGNMDWLVAGFSQKTNSPVIFPVEFKDSKISYWVNNFIPKNDGTVKTEVPCGEHGSEYNIIKEFKFDRSDNSYKSIFESKKYCNFQN
ncbi:MAG: hypothetical protein ACOYMB_04810 [Patescibacteria group bacterium]